METKKMWNLENLNDLLFERLEALGNEDLQGEELATEINRSEAMTKVSGVIIQNASLALSVQKLKYNLDVDAKLPKMLE